MCLGLQWLVDQDNSMSLMASTHYGWSHFPWADHLTVLCCCSDSLMRGLRKVNVRLAQKIRASAGGHSGTG